ncbi:endonuclease/exonuclease/phosphatase family protein [Sabulicella glaciei]|uniref:endonuclease/exonuclease/phosphatase family protein n=1 Tax=Sabulicella glaciei TaxID=2984948 RepID=UPI0034A0A013
MILCRIRCEGALRTPRVHGAPCTLNNISSIEYLFDIHLAKLRDGTWPGWRHTMRSVLLSLVLLFACSSKSPGSQPPVFEDIRLITWNIAWATDQVNRIPSNTPFRRSDQDWASLSSFIRGLRGDIFALQEVDGVSAARRFLPMANFETVLTTPSDLNQTLRPILAARRGIEVRQMPDLAEIGKGGLRAGLDASVVTNGVVFRLLIVHLKADCRNGEVPLHTPACRELREQIPHIVAWIRERRSDGTPYVILGDFNRELNGPGDELWQQLNAADTLHLVSQPTHDGCAVSGIRGRQPDGRPWPAIDHIILSSQAASWLIGEPQGHPLPNPDPGRPAYSDHCPLSLVLRPR